MSLVLWENDDAGYERWVDDHPGGFLGNMNKAFSKRYLKVHRATCRLPDRSNPDTEEPRTGAGYRKITALTLAEVAEWAESENFVFGARTFCKRCLSELVGTPNWMDAIVKVGSEHVAARSPIGRPYEMVGTIASSSHRVPFDVDPDAIDRGIQAHATTQDAVAQFLIEHEVTPLSPNATDPEYDVAWRSDSALFVAEVKSITNGNEERQLRLGLGQVLRYRQDLAVTEGTVVAALVMERAPSDPGWLRLCQDLNVLLAWPGAFNRLLAPVASPEETGPTDVDDCLGRLTDAGLTAS